MALCLHAVILSDTPSEGSRSESDPRPSRTTAAFRVVERPHDVPRPSGGVALTTLIPFRDLCAVVSEQKAFVLNEATPDIIALHRTVVDNVFRNSAVLPAPVGVVFRTPD